MWGEEPRYPQLEDGLILILKVEGYNKNFRLNHLGKLSYMVNLVLQSSCHGRVQGRVEAIIGLLLAALSCICKKQIPQF